MFKIKITYFEGFERPFDLKHVLFGLNRFFLNRNQFMSMWVKSAEKKWAPFRHHPWIAFDMNLQSRQRANKAIESHLVACVLMVSFVSSFFSFKKAQAQFIQRDAVSWMIFFYRISSFWKRRCHWMVGSFGWRFTCVESSSFWSCHIDGVLVFFISIPFEFCC